MILSDGMRKRRMIDALQSHPVVGDEEIPCDVEDERVEVSGVEGQRVVVVETVDLDVAKAHLIVGKDGVGVDRVGGDDWEQICEKTEPCLELLCSFLPFWGCSMHVTTPEGVFLGWKCICGFPEGARYVGGFCACTIPA